MTINRIARTLEQVENKALDPVGYVPILSTVTGAARGILGSAELIAGIGSGFIGLFATREQEDKYFNFASHCFTHGAGNLTRAAVEVIPFVNMITLAYDGDHKQARLSYGDQEALSTRVIRSLENLETKTLDPLGYVPVLSTATGAIRGVLATAELIAGIFSCLISFLGNGREQEKCISFAKHCFTHGIGNLARAAVEVIPLINLITLAFDGDRKEGRFSYLTLQTE